MSVTVTVTDIESQIKDAMRAREKTKLSTLRLLLAELENTAVAKRMKTEDLTGEEVLEAVGRQVKRRVEAAEAYRKAGRDDLADKEAAEAEILKTYLPAQLSEGEVLAIVAEAVSDTGAAGPGDMGKVMGAVMPKVKGKADGKLVNQIVRDELAKL